MASKEYINKFTNKSKALFAGFSSMLGSRNGNIVLAVIIILLINIVSAFVNFRFDITMNRAYSLSPISKSTIKNLHEPLIVKVFASNDTSPSLLSVRQYLSDILEEYDNLGSNFRYEFVNVEDDAGKKLAASYGIQAIADQEMSADQFKARNVYMGLVLIHGDLVESLGEITSPEGLEYKITTTVRKMIGKTDALLSVKSPVKVTLYYSNELKNFKIQGYDKIEETLKSVFDKVNANCYNKLEYNKVDASSAKTVDELSQKYGIQKIPWAATRFADGRTIPSGAGVLGVVVEYGNRFKVIPVQIAQTIFGGNVISGLEKIDERINSAVGYVLSQNSVIGYVTGHGERDLGDDREGAANLKNYISGVYDLNEVDLTKEDISDDINILMVNGPKGELSEQELFKIDQFMMRGGNVLFLVDSFNEVRNQQNPYSQPQYFPVDSGLSGIFSNIGVSVGKDYILDRKCVVQRQDRMDIPLYFVPLIEKKSLDSKNIATKYLKNLVFIQASSLTIDSEKIKKNGLSSSVLVSSSDESWKMEGRINLVPFMITPPAKKDLSKYNLAVAVEGKFKSAFGGKNPSAAKKVQKTGSISSSEGLESSAKNSRVVIIGSSQITTVDPAGKHPNAIFLHNVIDYLNGTYGTQQMRSKSIEFNPLEKTNELTRYLIKFLNIFIVPLISVVAGLLMWRRRKLRKKRIQAQFSTGAANE